MDRIEPSAAPKSADDDRERAVLSLFREIERSGALPDQIPAYEAADVVLCALEMRLPRIEAEEVVRDVPPTLAMLIRRCVIHRSEDPVLEFDENAFVRLIASTLHVSFPEAERVTRAVFVAVQSILPEDETLEVRDKLPRDVNALWWPPEPRDRGEASPVVGARPVEEPVETILREIEMSAVLPAGMTATAALQAVLCTVTCELTAHEAQELAASSPTFLRLLGPCASHRDERPNVMERQELLQQLAEHLGVDERHAERITRAVLAAVRGRLSPDEIRKIDNRMPRSVQSLWR